MLGTFTAYIFIPVYTILFAWGTDWFDLNFSVIGSLATRRNLFLIWGVVVGTYFYLTLRKIIARIPRNHKERVLAGTALFLLACSIVIPYLPDDQPFGAFLHVIFAFSASVLLLLCLYMVVWKLYCMKQQVYKPYLTTLHGITLFSMALLFMAGIVSSALEIFFTISCTILIHKLFKKVTAVTLNLNSILISANKKDGIL